MKIECKLKREGGSTIDIGGVAYEFKPQADGAHVADVGNKEHAERFLSIPEAYGIYRAGKKEETVETKAPAAPTKPEGDGTTPPANVSIATLSGDELKAAYKERFGKAPHHSWSEEQIINKLQIPSK